MGRDQLFPHEEPTKTRAYDSRTKKRLTDRAEQTVNRRPKGQANADSATQARLSWTWSVVINERNEPTDHERSRQENSGTTRQQKSETLASQQPSGSDSANVEQQAGRCATDDANAAGTPEHAKQAEETHRTPQQSATRLSSREQHRWKQSQESIRERGATLASIKRQRPGRTRKDESKTVRTPASPRSLASRHRGQRRAPPANGASPRSYRNRLTPDTHDQSSHERANRSQPRMSKYARREARGRTRKISSTKRGPRVRRAPRPTPRAAQSPQSNKTLNRGTSGPQTRSHTTN